MRHSLLPKQPETSPNRWTHQTARALACAGFLMILTGGMVTSYAAGMAVPDWPQTYGYNRFLYPPHEWLSVWGVFLQHGHRLCATAVALIAIALAVLLWRYDRRKWIRAIGAIALAVVFVEGTLGGLRVVGSQIVDTRIMGLPTPAFLAGAAGLYALASQILLAANNQRRAAAFWVRTVLLAVACCIAARWGVWSAHDKLLLAKIHGATAPVFFSLVATLVVLTSPAWITRGKPQTFPAAGRVRQLTVGCAVGIFLQIVLGVQLQHIGPTAGLWWFPLWIWLHLIVAVLVSVAIAWLLLLVRGWAAQPRTTRRVWILAVLFAVQFALGLATWVTNYGWPLWFTDIVWRFHYTIVAEGVWQAVFTTAHICVSSLCLAAAVVAALWSRQCKIR